MHLFRTVETDNPIYLHRNRYYQVPTHSELVAAVGGSVTLPISGNYLYKSPEMEQAVELEKFEFHVVAVVQDGEYNRAIGRIRLLPADIWLHSEIVYTDDPGEDGVAHLLWSKL